MIRSLLLYFISRLGNRNIDEIAGVIYGDMCMAVDGVASYAAEIEMTSSAAKNMHCFYSCQTRSDNAALNANAAIYLMDCSFSVDLVNLLLQSHSLFYFRAKCFHCFLFTGATSLQPLMSSYFD